MTKDTPYFMIKRSPEQYEEGEDNETNEIGELKNYLGGIVVFDGSCNFN